MYNVIMASIVAVILVFESYLLVLKPKWFVALQFKTQLYVWLGLMVLCVFLLGFQIGHWVQLTIG